MIVKDNGYLSLRLTISTGCGFERRAKQEILVSLRKTYIQKY